MRTSLPSTTVPQPASTTESGNAERRKLEPTPRRSSDAIRWLLTLAAVAGCARESIAPDAAVVPDCSLEVVLEDWKGPPTSTDCGVVPVGSDGAAQATARDCVLAAIAAGDPFFVDVHWNDPLGSFYATGYIGHGAGEEPTLYYWEHSPAPDGEDLLGYTYVYACSNLRHGPGCSRPERTLCLVCDDETPVELCCEESRRAVFPATALPEERRF